MTKLQQEVLEEYLKNPHPLKAVQLLKVIQCCTFSFLLMMMMTEIYYEGVYNDEEQRTWI
jgi:hypothetical protein